MITQRELVHHFFHHDPEQLRGFRPQGGAYLWKTVKGPYVVRTWTDRDGRPVATGWFKES